MGCPFCATGNYGYYGNLSVRDIINQIISIPEAGKVTHVVFMGMGEPMDNLKNVLKACNIITAQWGLSIGVRNVTVSTVGILPAVKDFLEGSGCNLSLSLYSPFPEERLKIVPAEKRYPSGTIIDLMKGYTSGKRRRMTVAYVMIKGINDSDGHLKELKRLIGNSGIRVNLLPFHRIPGSTNESSAPGRIQFFRHDLVISGISASIRKSRGEDVSAACGLLASGLNQHL
jgi:23S rRNA (adenine2503-C2)-methyltransferase